MGAVWTIGVRSLTEVEAILASGAVTATVLVGVYWEEITGWFWATFVCGCGIQN